jgi:glycerophosphoryl diester phosphodiesterase
MIAVHGHRGARGLCPENTLAGCRRTLALGVDAIEIDLGMTEDGVLVLCHDPVLNPAVVRDDSGRWLDPEQPLLVRTLRYDALERFDVGRLRPDTSYARRFATQTPIDNERIPSFDAFLRMVAEHRESVGLDVEIKFNPSHSERFADPERLVAATLDMLRGHDLIEVSMIQSFDWRIPELAKSLDPSVRVGCLSCRHGPDNNIDGNDPPGAWTAGRAGEDFGGSVARMVHDVGAEIWTPNFEDIVSDDVGEGHALGLEVIPWTVNEADDLKHIAGLGVDGIITDYPDRLFAILPPRS